ncbi:malonate decarboxylase holo-ACP synthase [Pokkaliibacter plantistimulans]|uniref:malonate decarboxylase holo-ACP synthase n=1 Tax=Pokkaliibacter plantistimulans TaxID=1635171 RepID=UPI000D740392|nr:malonate decarboxylase holo-ACP synthase [Pokkaliibacter plantistimulans]
MQRAVSAGQPGTAQESDWTAHDLLWAARSALLPAPQPGAESITPLPAWLAQVQGPVVIRRDQPPSANLLPVGVRGASKAERYAAYLPRAAVLERLTPEQLVSEQRWCRHPLRLTHPVLRMLDQLAGRAAELGLRWGITGSLGYELASGQPLLHDDSDLDLLIRTPSHISPALAQEWQSQLLGLSPLCRVDIQLETPLGAVALAEWAAQSDNRPGPVLRQGILLKSNAGPQLVTDPWQARPHACPAESATPAETSPC